jgi:hypothetical protein
MVQRKRWRMAKIKGGILGTVSGKVSGVVAGQWKDKNYVRQYAIPANPKSDKQQTQRALFGQAVAFGKPLVGQIFNPFVDPFQKSMSGFNYFIKQNIKIFEEEIPWSNIKITFGKLYIEEAIADPTYSPGKFNVEFETTLGANGKDEDIIRGVIYRVDTGRFYFNVDGVARSTGTIAIPVSDAAVGKSYRYYLFAAQYDANDRLVMVSDSISSGWTYE